MAKNEVELSFPILSHKMATLAEVRIHITSDLNPNLIVDLSLEFLNAAAKVQELRSVHSTPTSSCS